MRATAILAVATALVFRTGPADAQSIDPKQSYGHVEWREVGEERRRELYEIASGLQFGERTFHFVSQNPLDVDGALWSEVDVQLDASASGRVVVEVGMADGKYAAEYYFDEGGVSLVYETRYFVPELAPQPVSTNFKGFPAWERLSIVREGTVLYSHSGGRGAPRPGIGGARFAESGAALLNLVSAGK